MYYLMEQVDDNKNLLCFYFPVFSEMPNGDFFFMLTTFSLNEPANLVLF